MRPLAGLTSSPDSSGGGHFSHKLFEASQHLFWLGKGHAEVSLLANGLALPGRLRGAGVFSCPQILEMGTSLAEVIDNLSCGL